MSRPRAIHHVNKCVTAQLLYVLTLSSCSLEEFLSRREQLQTCSSAPEKNNISSLEQLRSPAGPTNGPCVDFPFKLLSLTSTRSGSWVSSVTSESREKTV